MLEPITKRKIGALEVLLFSIAFEVFTFDFLSAVVFIVLAVVLWQPAIRFRIVPRRAKHARAHAMAMGQFLAQGLHQTENRTGVLIFAAVAERYAEVVADAGIYAKVTPAVWDEAVAALIDGMRDGRPGDGFVAAIEQCGAVLAEHFPPGALDRDAEDRPMRESASWPWGSHTVRRWSSRSSALLGEVCTELGREGVVQAADDAEQFSLVDGGEARAVAGAKRPRQPMTTVTTAPTTADAVDILVATVTAMLVTTAETRLVGSESSGPSAGPEPTADRTGSVTLRAASPLVSCGCRPHGR